MTGTTHSIDGSDDAVGDPSPAPHDTPAPRACENCGAELLGDHCYACGQPVKGLVRHFSSILGDFADSVFTLDTRLPRTLWPLFARPAFLTCEYFAGRRVRYVSPVRLFVFLTIVTFFIAQLTVSFGDDDINIGSGNNGDIASGTTVAEVEVPGALPGIVRGEETIRDVSAARIKALRNAIAKGEPVPVPDKDGLSFGDSPWDAKANPIKVDALPAFANDWLNAQAGRADKNIERFKEDSNLLKDALLSAVPSTLFVLLGVRGDAETAVRLQEAAVHGTADRGAAQPRVPEPDAAADVADHCAAALAGARRRRTQQHLLLAAGRYVGVDAVVPVADAETRLRPRLADDAAEVLRAWHLLRDPSGFRRGLHSSV